MTPERRAEIIRHNEVQCSHPGGTTLSQSHVRELLAEVDQLTQQRDEARACVDECPPSRYLGALANVERLRREIDAALSRCKTCGGKGFIEQRPVPNCRGCGRQYPQVGPNRLGVNLVNCESCGPLREALEVK